MRQLVLVHGRSQQHKDALALKGEWITALRSGLAKSNLSLPIPEADIRFPYYGQTLFDLVNGVPADEAARVIVRGAVSDQLERKFVMDILKEVQDAAGITDAQVEAIMQSEVIERGIANWEWVQGILKAIDRHVPFASSSSIALFTNDVFQYLNNVNFRTIIEDGVAQALRNDLETVVVGHSLGSVVAYRVLREQGKHKGWKVPLFVTVGSPLGVTAIKKSLAVNKHPECATKWFNAMDDRDIVALYPLSKKHFAINPEIENKMDVQNHTDNRHGIAGYLDDAEVARRIYEALTT